MSYVLAIDQGTTSSRAIVFRADISIAAHGAAGIPAAFSGLRLGRARAGGHLDLHHRDLPRGAAEGRCRRRRTSPPSASPTSAKPPWCGTAPPARRSTAPSSGRTAAPPTSARRLKAEGHEPTISAKTGLILDPYFSGTKVAWILDHVPGARERAERGELVFGTVDCYLLWRLTGGKVHATDATNASRTLLFNIHTGAVGRRAAEDPAGAALDAARGEGFLGRFRREPCPNCSAAPSRSRGIAGDQQAATIGQACFTPGMIKSTYGTGCFALLNTGTTPVKSSNKLLTTIAYQLKGQRTYALEGSIFVAGSAVQWLRDGLGIIKARRRNRPARRPVRLDAERLSGAGLCRPRRALLESAGARRAVRADPQHRPGRTRPCRAGKRLLPDLRSVGGDARRLARGRRPPTSCCGSMAA